MPDPTTIIDITEKIYVKYGAHFASYIFSILMFSYFFFKYLAARDVKENELRDKTKKELDESNARVVSLMADHSKDNDIRRQAFTDMLTHQLDTAKDMMENISKQNLEAHKILAERVGTIEGKLNDFAVKVDSIASNVREISTGIRVKIN